MTLNRPVHFEFHSADPAKTNAFFSDVFGWKISGWPGPTEYWLATTGPEKAPACIDGGIMRSRDGNQRTVNTIQVQNVDEASARVVEAGGAVCVPKMAIQGVGYLCYCTDPAGVLFGMMHEDRSAR